jgi:hypothetical protein
MQEHVLDRQCLASRKRELVEKIEVLSLLFGAFFKRCWWWVFIEVFSEAVLEGMLGREVAPGCFLEFVG